MTNAAEPPVTVKDLPRFPAVEPKDAPATLKLRPGIRAGLAACEPLVASPVAIAFDERHRMYVVEMRDYPLPELRDQRLGRIRLLTDTDGDGVYDQATIFAEGLGWPTAIACYDGGVFVGCAPEIIYLKDTDGDGRADVRHVAFAGFAGGPTTKANVQALLNSFHWGIDNRIHVSASMSGGKVTRGDFPFSGRAKADGPNSKEAPIDLRGKNFSFDPRTGDARAESGGGQHGLSFDDAGRPYVCSNSHHLQTLAYAPRYAGRSPYYSLPPALVDIATDGPAAEVFRASPEEPWRVIRTKWRVSGLVPGPVEGGGRSAGYFTGATGATIYRGDALGPAFAGNAFIGDAGGNLVNRKVIRPKGALVEGSRAPDEPSSEFLASTDTWFRPVQFANGPDGALYVIDMYRETIEHPWSLPDSIKQHLDLTSGRDRGRIWRITAQDWKRPALPKLAGATTAALVAHLASPNGWTRDTAARLLFERHDAAAAAGLRELCRPANPPAAVHALWALDGLSALTDADVRTALASASEPLVINAMRLAERRGLFADIARRVTADPPLTPAARYQAALSLSMYVPEPGPAGDALDAPVVAALAAIAQADAADPWSAAAVLNAAEIRSRASALLAALGGDKVSPARALLAPLAQIVGAQANGADAAAVLELATARLQSAPLDALAIADALGAGLHAAKVPLDVEKADALLTHAAALVADGSADPTLRAMAASLLGRTSWEHHAADLLPLLDAKHPPEVQRAALAALDALDTGELAKEVLARWPALSPAVRDPALALLVKRPARATLLLDALAAGKLRRTDLSGSQQSALRQSSDATIKRRAAQLLAAPAGKRDEVIRAFAGALTLQGDARHGQQLYLARCAACHRLAGQGNAVGPDLETVRTTGREKLLTNILDPNREVAPAYAAYTLETTDGDTHVGLIAADTPTAVTLKMAAGLQVDVARPQIKSLMASSLSLMPEGLEDGLKAQDLADLLTYIEK